MSFILPIIAFLLVLAIDQFTKYIVFTNMELGQTVTFIDGLLDFTYIHNDGGAWGMFGGYRTGLLVTTSVMMLIILILIIKNGRKSKLFLWAGSLIISGGIGNMIDRIFRDGNVIDFLEVKFIDFPIFNIADCGVCIGAGLLILYFIIDMIKENKEKAIRESLPEDAKE